MILPLTSKLSLPELRYLVSIVNERVHPDFIFFLLTQCRRHISTGTNWSQIGTTEVDLLVLMVKCHRNRIIAELKATLAKNQRQPLNFDDAELLSHILDDASHYNLDWNQLPVSPDGLREIIVLAACGYEHVHQQTA